MRTLFLFLIFFISLILQTTLLSFLRIGGIMPDLLLIFLILVALLCGSLVGGVLGFTVGLAQDLLRGRYLGLQALSGLLTGYLVGCLESKVYKENPLVSLFFVFLGSFLYHGIFFIGQGLVGTFFFSPKLFWQGLVPEAFYNTLLTLFFFRPFYRLVGRQSLSGINYVGVYRDYRG